ncbi:MAG: M15 family metallopeptidase [Oscillospiraceae bacterium]|nr:M15 family metallopeptidase [Oscillospiraceae bacterium]
MKKEFVFVILLSALLITLVFFTTMPGRKRAEEKKTETSVSETTPTVTTTEKKKPEVDADNPWAFYIVSKEYPLPEDFTVYPKKIQDDYEMDYRAANYFLDMKEAAAADGIELTVISAKRSRQYQQQLFNQEVESFIAKGMSDEEAFEAAREWVALPGESEHNSGLAVDLNDLDESFEESDAFKWLSEHAHEYGFILRYPKDKVGITGVKYEPWHYRFVGVYHATQIKEKGITLEEYYDEIRGD